jgi:DNA repair protein RadC
MMKVKEMARGERPRERLERFGAEALSDAELLALVLEAGTQQDGVMELSHKLIKEHGSLEKISGLSAGEFRKTHGIGRAKACQLMACFELGRRMHECGAGKKEIIRTSRDVVKRLALRMRHFKREHFVAFYLDSKMGLITQKTIAIGTLNSSIVHPREVFAPAVSGGAAAVILAHNHPSGDPGPSKYDVETTEQLCEAGKILGMELLDHVIIGVDGYFSFKEEGLL